MIRSRTCRVARESHALKLALRIEDVLVVLRRDQPVGQFGSALGTGPGVAKLQALKTGHEGALASARVSEHVLADVAGHKGFCNQFARREHLVGIIHAHEDVQSC